MSYVLVFTDVLPAGPAPQAVAIDGYTINPSGVLSVFTSDGDFGFSMSPSAWITVAPSDNADDEAAAFNERVAASARA